MMVCVLETGDAFLIQQAKALLDSEGIETVLPGEHFNNIIPSHSLATGPLRLYVSEEDEDEARSMLSTTFGTHKPPEPEQNENGPDLYCPNCGSMRITDSGGPLIAILLRIASMLGGSKGTMRTGRKCKNCGHTW